MAANRKLRLILSVLITSALWAAPLRRLASPAWCSPLSSTSSATTTSCVSAASYHSGLARLLDKGAVFTDAHYLHAATVTAVGHSTFLSGATPSVSGIVGNEWYDRTIGATVTSVSDPATKVGEAFPALLAPRRGACW